MRIGGFIRLVGALALLAVPVAAQSITEDQKIARHSITGNIALDRKGPPADRLLVRLVPNSGAGYTEIWSDSTGRFEFTSIRSGEYTVIVRAPVGSAYDDGESKIMLFDNGSSINYSVTVTLKLAGSNEPVPTVAPAATIAVDPDASVPAAARKQWKKGVDAAGAGDAEKAIESFRKALAVAPDYTAALNDLGVALMHRGEYAEARAALTRAAEKAPKALNPHVNLALVCFQLEDADCARTEIDRALAIDPASTRATWLSGELALHDGRPNDAIPLLKKAVDAGDATSSAAALSMGRAYESLGQTASAVEAYRLVMALEPASERAAKAAARLEALGVKD